VLSQVRISIQIRGSAALSRATPYTGRLCPSICLRGHSGSADDEAALQGFGGRMWRPFALKFSVDPSGGGLGRSGDKADDRGVE